jgi:hypothetical protein
MEEVQEESKKHNGEDVEDSVFRRIAIPRTLGNISMEKVEKELFGEESMPLYHKVVIGIDKDNTIK